MRHAALARLEQDAAAGMLGTMVQPISLAREQVVHDG